MQRTYTSTDARRLLKEHRSTISKLHTAQKQMEKRRDEIVEASEDFVANEVIKTLREIPVEEINRDKKGFRIKALRDGGYSTIADLATASVYSLASVYGISQDAAHSIKRVTEDIVSKTRENTRIKLSSDNKNKYSTKLVHLLSVQKRSQPIIDNCTNLLEENEQELSYALEDLNRCSNGIKWFFSSKQQKERSINAYKKLQEMSTNQYGTLSRLFLDQLNKVESSNTTEAWEDFSNDSVRLVNLLEDVNPDVLGNDDAVYGLPEDLAREIQDECFFPDGLLCELRRYQEWGVKYVLHQENVLLGDEMGLGKTVQAIATMVSLRNTGATHFVVVCPASVIANWCREIAKMSKLRVTKVHGSGRKGALSSWIKTGGVAVTTFETTSYFTLEDDFRFKLLIVDEAHYIKNPSARRTENVKALSKHSERLLFMTGTALENRVDEMVTLISMLQPKIARQVHGIEFLSAAPMFRKTVAPVYYRRKREDVLSELPDLIESREWCTLNREEEREYERAVLSKNYSEARRVSWNINDLNESSKAIRLKELVEEAESDGRKVIVFSFFLDTIRKVTELLGRRCMNPIVGSVNPQRRQEIIDEFDNAPAGSVLVAQIQSGGTGLNIQSASVVILCEPQFKPSIENQAISRAYRMGQTRNVLVYRLLCENTVDERIMSLLENKQAIFDAFADKSEAAKQSMEIDDRTFGNIIKEEIDRINAKYGENNINFDKNEDEQ